MRSRGLAVIHIRGHISLHHRIMIVMRRMIVSQCRWGSNLESGSPIWIDMLPRYPICVHGIINNLLCQRIFPNGSMRQVTLMSLVLWGSPSNCDRKILLMLCHYIVGSLLQFLDWFLHLIVLIGYTHVIILRVYSMWWLTGFECWILNLRWLLSTDTLVVVAAECGVSELCGGVVEGESAVIGVALEDLNLTPLDLLARRLQDLVEADRRIRRQRVRRLLRVIRTACILTVVEGVIGLWFKAWEKVLETFQA